METAPAQSIKDNTSSRGNRPLLRWMTAGSPTNHNMLLFRTLNRELQQPNTNADTLAPLFRDKLMPLRIWWLKHMPGALKLFKQGLEHKKHGVPGVLNFVDARTSWLDAVVKDALDQHNISQVVVVAAGFDTRAYRIGAKHKDVRFFEVDLPHASTKKQQLVEQLLQPEASFPRPTFLAADLSTQQLDAVLLSTSSASSSSAATAAAAPTTAAAQPCSPPAASAATTTAAAAPGAAAAAAAGVPASGANDGSGGSSSEPVPCAFDPHAPTLFTVEGLVYYLPEEAVQELFGAMVRVAAPGSRVAFDFLHKQVLDGSVPMPPAYKVTAASVANKGEPFISGIGNSKEAVGAFLNSKITTTTTTTTTTTANAFTAASSVGTGAAPDTPAATSTAAPTEAGAAEEQSAAASAAAAAAAGDYVLVGAADGSCNSGGDVGVDGSSLKWQVVDYLTPRDMVAKHLPHLTWNDELPPILSFYSFATAVVTRE